MPVVPIKKDKHPDLRSLRRARREPAKKLWSGSLIVLPPIARCQHKRARHRGSEGVRVATKQQRKLSRPRERRACKARLERRREHAHIIVRNRRHNVHTKQLVCVIQTVREIQRATVCMARTADVEVLT